MTNGTRKNFAEKATSIHYNGSYERENAADDAKVKRRPDKKDVEELHARDGTPQPRGLAKRTRTISTTRKCFS